MTINDTVQVQITDMNDGSTRRLYSEAHVKALEQRCGEHHERVIHIAEENQGLRETAKELRKELADLHKKYRATLGELNLCQETNRRMAESLKKKEEWCSELEAANMRLGKARDQAEEATPIGQQSTLVSIDKKMSEMLWHLHQITGRAQAVEDRF